MTSRGLVLFVGATGSGKSTSLASMIQYRNQNAAGHILTIEDPIEFIHKNQKSIVNQREVGIDTLTYERALENALREAPDVILIGEVRSRDTMDHALAYAETGHLCMSTLHANNANQAVERIINFFPEDRKKQLLMDLSLNLKAVVSQRLLPIKGQTGRIAAIEVLINTPAVADLIYKGEVGMLKEAMGRTNDVGMQTFDRSLLDLYAQGLVEYEDALRAADSQNDLRLAIKQDCLRRGVEDPGAMHSSEDKWQV
jgi:twitching motility protein PilU